MAPKAATKASAPKKTAAAPAHGSYQDMIKDAIIQLKERKGSSRQTLKKYVLANNDLGQITDATFSSRFNQALSKGSENGTFERPKGASGPVKLGKPSAKPTKASSPAATTKPAPKTAKAKTATKAKTTKAAAPKKTATKKAPATKAAAPKKTATKANTGKARKTAPAAPAVEDKPATVTGKTKSGRVTKTKAAPAPKKAAPKKTAAKKATAKK